MATAGPNYAGTAADDATVGTVSWLNPTLAQGTADGATAQATNVKSSVLSHYCKCTNFGFSIPAGATINGITVEYDIKGVAGAPHSSRDNSIKIVQGGTISGTDKATSTAYTTTLTFISAGGSADLWGLTWTSTDINASTFGVAISVKGVGTKTATVLLDAVRITIDYTAAATSSVDMWHPRVETAYPEAWGVVDY